MSEMRWLKGAVGKRVLCDFDADGQVCAIRKAGVLTELRASEPRVRLDGEARDRTVASWRITVLPDPRGGAR